jgi:hypothetical protein
MDLLLLVAVIVAAWSLYSRFQARDYGRKPGPNELEQLGPATGSTGAIAPPTSTDGNGSNPNELDQLFLSNLATPQDWSQGYQVPADLGIEDPIAPARSS